MTRISLLIAAVFVLNASGLHAGTESGMLPQRTLFDFERGLADWSLIESLPANAGIRVASVPREGSGQALALAFSFPGEGGAMVALNETWRDYQSISFEVSTPADAPPDLKFFVYIKDKEWLWYQTGARLLAPGSSIVVYADLSGASLDWVPVGHRKPWNFYSTVQIRELGIRVSSASKVGCTVFLDNIRLQPGLFSDVRMDKNETEVHRKFKAGFTLSFVFEQNR